MEPSQGKAVFACLLEIASNLVVEPVVLSLRSGLNPVLRQSDAEEFRKKLEISSDAKVAVPLLELLVKTKGAYHALLSALRQSNQGHLAETILSHEAEIIQLELVETTLGGLVDELRPELVKEAKGESTTTTPLLDQSATTLTTNLIESFDLREKNESLTTTIDALTTTSARLTEERDELQTKLTQVRQELHDSQATSAGKEKSLEERVRDLETQLLGKETELLLLHDQDRLVRERTELTTALDQTKTELDQTKGALVESRSREQQDGLNIAYQRSLLDSIAIALIIGGDRRETTIEAVSLFGGPLRTGVLHVSVTHSSATRLPDGRVLHTGGQAAFGAPPTAACSFIDAATLTFSTAPELPGAVAEHATATLGGTTFSVGGWDGEKQIPDCAAFRNGAWKRVKAMRGPRRFHALASDGAQLAVVGGWDGNKRLSTVELYSPGANVWTSGPDIGTAMYGLRAAYLDGRFFVVGGWGGSINFPTVEAWDPRTPAWESLAPMGSSRQGHGLLALDGKLIAFGGCIRVKGKDKVLDTVEVYDPAADRWTPTKARLSNPGGYFAYCAL